ncbi:hypothetical protein SUDANB96_03120 [Streptomyces sp. enrichment culture]
MTATATDPAWCEEAFPGLAGVLRETACARGGARSR